MTDQDRHEPAPNEDVFALNKPVEAGVQIPATGLPPGVSISADTLVFANTFPGEDSFLLLTIRHHTSATALTLRTNAPNHFQFATENRPTFQSALTLTPLASGTAVHVRFTPDAIGYYETPLLADGADVTPSVVLSGRSPLFVSKKWLLGLLLFFVISGLAYVGHHHRCKLVPGLCQDLTEPNRSQTERPVSPPFSFQIKKALEASERLADPAQRTKRLVPAIDQKPAFETVPPMRNAPARSPGEAVSNQFPQPVLLPAPNPEESDLERELNQKTYE